jgi:hypothetical protein
MIYLDDFKILEGNKEIETLETLAEKTSSFIRERREKLAVEEGHTRDDGDFIHVTLSYAAPYFYTDYVGTFSIRFFPDGKWDLFITDLRSNKHHIPNWRNLAERLGIDEIVKFLEKEVN